MAGTAVATGLMPHQKDEHDVWICKDCGWKYPNAKPSPKIRKHHKKNCPGKAGAELHAAGGSSDDASDDEHHHHHHSVQGNVAPNQTALDASVPEVESKSRDIDFSSASAKEDLSSVTAPAEAVVVNGNAKETPAPEAAPTPAAVPVEASHGGLMPHQKDEHDIWICKACGWKYPNAKPSPKIRKNHKKHCPGKNGAVAAAGGSSDEASDDEHHHHPIPAPAAAVEPAQQESGSTASAPAEAPISKDIDVAALKESAIPAVNDETPAEAVEADAGKSTGDLSLTSPVSEPASLEKAKASETVPEEAKVSETLSLETSVATGLMPHQKDAHDIWICKDCGWKYPNAKPSAKIRNHHRKKCPGKASSGAATTGGSSDEASDGEHPSSAVEIPPAVEPGKEDPAVAPEVPESISREKDFGLPEESPTPAVENENTPASTVETTPSAAVTETTKAADSLGEEPGKPTPTAEAGAVSLKEALTKDIDKDEKVAPTTTEGGLMLHQKHENDIWVCKECGWKYPNAKPSAKVRNNHKKKCPKTSGAAKGTNGGSSNGVSSEGEGTPKGVKCFPCLQGN